MADVGTERVHSSILLETELFSTYPIVPINKFASHAGSIGFINQQPSNPLLKGKGADPLGGARSGHHPSRPRGVATIDFRHL